MIVYYRLLAFSIVTREQGWVCPRITDQQILLIEDGRHPLYQLCNATFVSNSSQSGDQWPYITLITGPNGSGKTVYVKQVF